jgi:hypothetical protein
VARRMGAIGAADLTRWLQQQLMTTAKEA